MVTDDSFYPELNELCSDSLLQDVIDCFPDAIYIGDALGIPICNKKGLELLGYDSRDDLNKHFGDLANEIETCHPDTGKRLTIQEQPFALALMQGKSVVKRVLIKNIKTGKKIVVRCSAAPVKRDGKIIAAIAVNTNMDENIGSA